MVTKSTVKQPSIPRSLMHYTTQELFFLGDTTAGTPEVDAKRFRRPIGLRLKVPEEAIDAMRKKEGVIDSLAARSLVMDESARVSLEPLSGGETSRSPQMLRLDQSTGELKEAPDLTSKLRTAIEALAKKGTSDPRYQAILESFITDASLIEKETKSVGTEGMKNS